ncbi:sodium channel, voltage-gated, type I, beta a isoform X2 [Hoplias malabaricus]|uniref:sodium channel, voltage-gated, type I, beta a isoform X2 n=1 Tax=Hoplias malabaricus TaxID=27720 RepID=UPI00346354D4
MAHAGAGGHERDGACVELDSDTEAVVGKGFKVGCISCKMRGEVEATATVDWFFMASGESDFTHIYSYADRVGTVTDERFENRLFWNGSKNTLDLQDGSIYIHNVTFNDTGTYRCYFDRLLSFEYYEFRTNTTKKINLSVVAKATRGTASILSEVMMYVSIIGLQLWLLVEMVYCYKKIAAAGEEALRESALVLYTHTHTHTFLLTQALPILHTHYRGCKYNTLFTHFGFPGRN